MNNCTAYKYKDTSNYCNTKGKEFFLNIDECTHTNGTDLLRYYNITSNSFYSASDKNINFICTHGIEISRHCGNPLFEQNKNMIEISCNRTKHCIDIEGNQFNAKLSCSSFEENLYWSSFSLAPAIIAPTLISIIFGPQYAVLSLFATPLILSYTDDYTLHDVIKNYVSFDLGHFCEDHQAVCNVALFALAGHFIGRNMPALGSGMIQTD